MKFAANIACTLIAFMANAAEPPNFLIIYTDDLGYTQTSVPMMTGLTSEAKTALGA